MAEELVKELKDSIIESDTFGQMIHHPLIVSPYVLSSVEISDEKHQELVDHQITYFNKGLKSKQKQVLKAVEAKKWNHLLVLHERPYRLRAFVQFAPFMKPSEYWENLAWVWIDTEFPFQERQLWLDLFTANVKQRRKLMMAKERKTLQKLPENVTIYRGYNDWKGDSGPLGVSWTLSEEKAEWFAKRFATQENSPSVSEGICKKESILAYFETRDEQEIVIDPLDVNIVDNKAIYLENENLYKHLKAIEDTTEDA